MMPNMLTEYPWLWTLIWQSTVCLIAGLGLSYWLRHRPVRAHQILLLALAAAMFVPLLSGFVAQREWGWFVGKVQAVDSPEWAPLSITPKAALPPVTRLDGPRSVAIPTAPPVNRGIQFEFVLVSIWIAVSLLLLVRLIIRFVLGYCLVVRSTSMEKEVLRDMAEQAKALLSLKIRVAYHATPSISSPVVWCWSKKPKLLIPETSANEFEQLDWGAIVCHELAHWKRHDHITMLMAELLACCLPWHPLLWWTRQRLLSLSEQACDDWAMVASQGSTHYARTLLELTPQGKALLAPAVVNTRAGLGTRVRRIIEDRCASPLSGRRWTLTVAALVLCVIVGIAFAQTRPARIRPAQTRPAYTGVESTIQTTRRMRSIEFPEKRSLGLLYTRSPGIKGWGAAWDLVGEARGEASIPARWQAQLEVSQEAAVDLSALAGLGSNDLQMLCFNRKVTQLGPLVPVGHLSGLKALILPSGKFDVQDVECLQGLSQLESLDLAHDRLTDSAMPYVGGLNSLRSLRLYAPEVSDNGLKQLQGLTRLNALTLNNCQITDQGLLYLGNMIALERLQLIQTKISDGGLAHLQQFKRLMRVALVDNDITDAGLAHIDDLPHLARVFVKGIGDVGIVHLSKLPSLRTLQILDANLSRACIAHLKSMKSLQELTISGDVIPDGLFAMLRDALPDCKVRGPQRYRELDPAPDWLARFRAVYQLDKDQALRRIAPPFIPERKEYWLNEMKMQSEPSSLTLMFSWDGTLKRRGIGLVEQMQDLHSILCYILGLKTYEYEGPSELLDLKLPGDWIIRDDVSQEVKLEALEQILTGELGRAIHIEKQTVERQVVVVTGRFEYRDLPEKANDRRVYLYINKLDKPGGGSGGGGTSLIGLLEKTADCANIPVINNTETSNLTNIAYYRHHSARPLRRMESSPQKTELLKTFFKNLSQQTELRFELAMQPVEVWVISEED
jgi:beta-lactamase regulating signal transducer with metallopeptidase domain